MISSSLYHLKIQRLTNFFKLHFSGNEKDYNDCDLSGDNWSE